MLHQCNHFLYNRQIGRTGGRFLIMHEYIDFMGQQLILGLILYKQNPVDKISEIDLINWHTYALYMYSVCTTFMIHARINHMCGQRDRLQCTKVSSILAWNRLKKSVG